MKNKIMYEGRIDRDTREHFPLPEALSNARQLKHVDIWANNNGAILSVRFTPAFWTITGDCARLAPPSLSFEKMEVISISSDYNLEPHGYFHFSHTEKFHVDSPIFQQDDFSCKLDEFFVAQLWSGEMRQMGVLRLPGIGSSIQHRYFSRAPHEILEKKVFYA